LENYTTLQGYMRLQQKALNQAMHTSRQRLSRYIEQRKVAMIKFDNEIVQLFDDNYSNAACTRRRWKGMWRR
jgi:hypothetical protein